MLRFMRDMPEPKVSEDDQVENVLFEDSDNGSDDDDDG